MFRYKKSVPVSYERQGYIYFSSLLYREMPERAQRKILNLCMECGCCAYVCPAKRHLVAYNQLGKQMIRK